MKVVKFPVLAAERWTLARDFDNLRFDLMSARSLADRLRQRQASEYLAEMSSAENIGNALAHLEAILEFVSQLSTQRRILDCHRGLDTPPIDPQA
jgi:thioredoxin-like negative regulator of GroEL